MSVLNRSFGAGNVAHAPFLMEKTEGKISPRRSSSRRRIILKRLLKKWDGKAWSGFVRLRTRSLVGILLVNTVKNVRVLKTAEIFKYLRFWSLKKNFCSWSVTVLQRHAAVFVAVVMDYARVLWHHVRCAL